MMIRRSNAQSPWFRMMENMLDAVQTDAPVTQRDFAMAVDVREDDATYTIFAAIPGVQEDAISIQLHDGVLSIEAETHQEAQRENERTLIQERRYGRFVRSLRLPNDVNGEGIEATLANGVLKLTLPKTAQAQPRKIAIKGGNN